MTKPSQLALWLRCWCAMLLLSGIAITSADAQERASGRRATSSNPAVATDGATLIHGNYCGAGNRPGKPPIDALDLACMNHDACSPTGGVPSCDCNVRLRDEAMAVAQDSRQAPELRSLASLTAAAATVMICNPTITDAAAPPAAVAPVPAAPAAASAPTAPPSARPPANVPSVAANVPPVVNGPATAAPLSIVPESVAPATPAPVAAAPEAVSAPPAPAESSPVAEDPRARSIP